MLCVTAEAGVGVYRWRLTTGEEYSVLTGGAEEVTGVGSALGYAE